MRGIQPQIRRSKALECQPEFDRPLSEQNIQVNKNA